MVPSIIDEWDHVADANGAEIRRACGPGEECFVTINRCSKSQSLARLDSNCMGSRPPGAVEGVSRLREAGIHVAIASITWDFAVP